MGASLVIVDDHVGYRQQARALLDGDGFDVIGEAGDGFTAVAMCVAVRPDVVLLDIGLPDISGFEVARLLMERGVNAAVVLVSSRSRDDVAHAVASSGVCGFIPKDEVSADALRVMLGAGS